MQPFRRRVAALALLALLLMLPATVALPVPHTGYRSVENYLLDRTDRIGASDLGIDLRGVNLRIQPGPGYYDHFGSTLHHQGTWACETWRFTGANTEARVWTYHGSEVQGGVTVQPSARITSAVDERWTWRNETVLAGIALQSQQSPERVVKSNGAPPAALAWAPRLDQHAKLLSPVGDLSHCRSTTDGSMRLLFTRLPDDWSREAIEAGTQGTVLEAEVRSGLRVQTEERRALPPNTTIQRYVCGSPSTECLP